MDELSDEDKTLAYRAKKIHKFDYELFSSITASDSSIIKISNIH